MTPIPFHHTYHRKRIAKKVRLIKTEVIKVLQQRAQEEQQLATLQKLKPTEAN